jgi:hypothetical protein
MKGGATRLDELIRTNREEFRALATHALGAFSSDDRELAASMTTKYASLDNVIAAWTEQIAPMYRELDHKRRDARLKKTLIRHFGFHDNDAQRMMDVLADSRKQSLLQEVLDNVYHSDIEEPPYQREYAEEFLSWAPQDIDDFGQRYVSFAECVEAAERHNIILCDPYSSWVERQRAVSAINKERQNIAETEAERLESIDTELDHLTQKDHLLAEIIHRQMSLIHLLDLSAKYQKQLEQLGTKTDNPAARLKAFERTVSSYRDEEVQRIARAHHAHSLQTLSTIQSEISAIMLEVCELSATHRNSLLLRFQQYIKLTQEQELIQLIQHNRAHFFEQHD